jgi:hypothetical protein
MSSYWLGFFVGAFVATFLVSRLLLWLVKSWDGGTRKVIVVHALSLVVCVLLALVGGAGEGGSSSAIYAMGYAAPQLLWMLMDLRNQRRLSV